METPKRTDSVAASLFPSGLKKAEVTAKLLAVALRELDGRGTNLLEECGCCGGYHPADYRGECRDDAFRFATAYGEV